MRRDHFGAHSGIQQFIARLDPSRIHATVRAVTDADNDFPCRWPWKVDALRRALRWGIQRRGQPWYKLSDLLAELTTIGEWRRGELDVLHYVDGEHTAQFLPELARLTRARIRTLATYHQPPAILPSVVVRRVAAALDHVSVVSTTQRSFFESVLPPHRISVILHGVDTEFFSPREARSPTDVFRGITTGSYLRDWTLLGDVARRLLHRRDVLFEVVSGSAPPFDDLPNITVHRRIDDDALRARYRQADFLMLPMIDATANNALLEGMACGLPVIASEHPALREYADEGPAEFVAPDAESFAAAIESLAADSARRERMAAAARRRAEELSWPLIARQFESLYERMVGTV